MVAERLYYRKEKLRGACWEYQIEGGWVNVPASIAGTDEDRWVLHHRFNFYKPRSVEVRTATGTVSMERSRAEQWFFPDRWFSLLRFTTADDTTVGYYVNFSQPLAQLKENYYRDLDLELDLWVDPDGSTTELDRDEFDAEIALTRLQPDWAQRVNDAFGAVSEAVTATVSRFGPNLDNRREETRGLPPFILLA